MTGFEPGDISAHRTVSGVQLALIDGDLPAAAKLIDTAGVTELRNAFCILAMCWRDIAVGMLGADKVRRALAADALRQAALDHQPSAHGHRASHHPSGDQQ